MQITFDTNNARDLAILEAFISTAMSAKPTVADNGGTTATGSTLSLEGSGVDESAAPAVAPVTEKPKRVKKADVSKNEEKIDTTPEPVDIIDKPLSLDEVRAALQQFTASKGVPAGIELLKKYNAGRISELAEENFAAFAAECAA